MDNIVTYIKPKDNKMSADWDEVPDEIKETFDDDSTITATFAFNGSRIKLH